MASSIPFARQPVPAEPAVADLALGEQLVLWALRKRLESAAHRPALRRGFLLAGAGGPQAFAAFEQLFGVLESHCRRDLWFHRCGCGCGCVSADELRILGLIAAEQTGDVAAGFGHGSSLVAPAAVGLVTQAAAVVGQALAACRLTLPLRHLPEGPGAVRERLH